MTTAIAVLALIVALAALAAVIRLWWCCATRWTHGAFVERLADKRLLQHGREIGALRRKLGEPGA